MDTRPDYIDTTPFPTPAATWKYRAIYCQDSQKVGQWSNVAERLQLADEKTILPSMENARGPKTSMFSLPTKSPAGPSLPTAKPKSSKSTSYGGSDDDKAIVKGTLARIIGSSASTTAPITFTASASSSKHRRSTCQTTGR
jgi:hypothetical protein